jgi:glycosyltransferase involved in cell wall biosynthesis
MSEIHKKQILILSCFYREFGGGAEVYVDEITRKLRNNYDFIILTARLSRKLPKYEQSNGIKILRIGLGFKFDKYLYPIVAFFKIFSIRKDLIHAVMESYAGLALLFYRIIDKKIPALLTLQSGDVKMPKFLFKRIHQAPDKIQAISNYLAQRAKNFGAKNIEVIPNGINLEQFNFVSGNKQKHKIICVAHLRQVKGNRYLIAAMPKILEKFPDAKLVIIGEGLERKNLESEIRNLKLGNVVELKGRLNSEQVRRELQEAEVFVLPSLFEGMGIAVLEAQASNVPIIASNTGGIPDIVEDQETGILVEPKNSEQIADAVIKIFLDSNFAKVLAQNALREVRQYDWQNISQKIDKIYQQLLKQR